MAISKFLFNIGLSYISADLKSNFKFAQAEQIYYKSINGRKYIFLSLIMD